jgi:hypothetical protein
LFLQRAVLAEKELSVLKEQFERAEDSSKRQRLSSDQANEAPPPPNMDTPLDVMGRPSLLELAAKEKEVSAIHHFKKEKIRTSSPFLVVRFLPAEFLYFLLFFAQWGNQQQQKMKLTS